MNNETYLGLEDGFHTILFNYNSEDYIATVNYDENKNVQILLIEHFQEEEERTIVKLDDVDIDFLECFVFKELLDKLADPGPKPEETTS
jgi:predicted RNA-binding protein associated with RNAse of E/G family